MKPTNLYETIFKRRSIRKYDLTPLDENTLAEIATYMSTLKPMDDNIKIEMKLISQKDIKSFLPKAPHYIAVFSEIKDGYFNQYRLYTTKDRSISFSKWDRQLLARDSKTGERNIEQLKASIYHCISFRETTRDLAPIECFGI